MVLPLLGLAWLAEESAERAFLSVSVLLGIVSFSFGYFRHHRHSFPLTIFVVGILLILFARLLVEDIPRIEIPAVAM